MAEVLLFHHIHGLTSGVLDFAETLRRAGHTVHTPDLYEGKLFDDFDEGVAHARAVGFDTLIERGVVAAEGLPHELVYSGFSMGVMPTQKLAQTRQGARGALFFEACLPPSEFGDAWPEGVPVQIHGMDADPFFAGEGDIDAARELVDSTPVAELFLYPGNQHLSTDSSLPQCDEKATALLTQRVLAFLNNVDK
jgi:dienelactone hydrolase